MNMKRLARLWVTSHLSSSEGLRAATELSAFWEDWWGENMDEPWPLPRVDRTTQEREAERSARKLIALREQYEQGRNDVLDDLQMRLDATNEHHGEIRKIISDLRRGAL
jgi:hypothetical protein